MTWKTLTLFFKTLTADDMYSLLSRDNLKQPNQMHLSQKQKTFPQFFCAFLKSTSNFQDSEKKDDRHSLCISKITDFEIRC